MNPRPVGILSALALAAIACGSQSSGVDYGAYGTGGPGGPAASGSSAFANPAAPQGTQPVVANACRSGQALAQKLPLHIVMMLDRSGSMCEYNPNNTDDRDCNRPDSKWQQVRQALIAFFNNPTSQGLTMTVTQFPAAAGGEGNNCNANLYVQPSAQLIPLPEPSGALVAQIDARQSSNQGNTPTLDAMKGGMQLAVNIANSLQTPARVATLMATDGIPAGCNDANNIGLSAQVAAQYAQVIPTYVIGVGNQLQALDALAIAGGTKQAYIANTFSPALVAQYVAAAFETIRRSAVGCDFVVPPAPDGKKLDPQKVNVEYTTAAGKGSIGYSQGCASGAGWTYDNPADPKSIKLCPTTCQQVQNDAAAKIDLVFGCQTEAVK